VSGPIELTVGQLLLLNPNAWINLVGMFPLPHDTKKIEDIPAFELPPGYKLLLVARDEVVLLQRQPPALFAYNKQAYEWQPVQLAAKEG
jgi:hypothetical protein